MPQEALVSMNQSFFDAVRHLVELLHDEHGPLYLAAVVQFPSRPSDEWVLVVGSRPLAGNLEKGMIILSRAVADQLGAKFRGRVKRIGIVSEEDPFFRSLAGAIGVSPVGQVIVEHCLFDGIEIEHGAIFAAEKNVERLHGGAGSPE